MVQVNSQNANSIAIIIQDGAQIGHLDVFHNNIDVVHAAVAQVPVLPPAALIPPVAINVVMSAPVIMSASAAPAGLPRVSFCQRVVENVRDFIDSHGG